MKNMKNNKVIYVTDTVGGKIIAGDIITEIKSENGKAVLKISQRIDYSKLKKVPKK